VGWRHWFPRHRLEENAVHARVSTVEADGSFDEAAIGKMRRDVVPRVLDIPGLR
jgi:hypothetical protein